MLVNNAGLLRPGPPATLPMAEWNMLNPDSPLYGLELDPGLYRQDLAADYRRGRRTHGAMGRAAARAGQGQRAS